MSQQHAKGRDLEDAIQMIESAILKSDPSLKESSFMIEPRKVVICGDVRHEIDLYVSINHPKGYGSLFIFESKNWKEKVGKNEIIVLQEKINATAAQRGFIVAKGFTKDAINQAKKDDRLEILHVEEEFDVSVFPDFHVVLHEKPPHTDIKLIGKKGMRANEGKKINFDINNDLVNIEGSDTPAKDFVKKITESLIEERLSSVPTQQYSEGEHEFTIEKEIDYNPPLVCKGHKFELVTASVKFTIKIVRPKIVSKFDIKNRGRVINLESVAIGDGQMKFSFVAN